MTATEFVKNFTTGKLPGIELETDEQERIELTKRLKMGDLPQDFDDDELDFIGSWNGDNGDGAFPNVKVLEIYDLAQFGTEPSKFTWPLFAEFLRSEKEEWESHRPKGKRGHAQFALDVAIGDCFKAGMNSDEIAENCERMCDEREMEPDRRNRDGSYNAIRPSPALSRRPNSQSMTRPMSAIRLSLRNVANLPEQSPRGFPRPAWPRSQNQPPCLIASDPNRAGPC